MKNWKIYSYLLLTYVVMQIGSVYLSKFVIGYLQSKPDLTELQATYHGLAWSLFIVNTIAAIIFLLLLVPNKKFMNVFKGKKSTIGMTILWGFIGFFLAMAGQMIAGIIEQAMGITVGSKNTEILGDIARMSSIIILPMVLFAPFLEELIFRRVIFGGIYLKTNFWIATIVSAVVFAAVHNEFQHLLMYMMPAFAFAFVYYKTKRILAPMLAHLLMNGFVTIMQLNLDKIQKYLQQFEDMKQTFIIFFN
ncbi:type II CAAX endopeptidase family protein [Sporosarcina limicola]|uniref:Membrane protease YdiL (CAAX protease family) n=1 Tax=Sporosarcina limicola TaxID=34101 RepID=A0A927MLP1_9BACL|nr:membrane protease YdiL (CAAX protease family) [Sporosarcina limicola]